MIPASKSTLSLNNFKFLRPKVTKNLTNLPKKFCEPNPGLFVRILREKLKKRKKAFEVKVEMKKEESGFCLRLLYSK